MGSDVNSPMTLLHSRKTGPLRCNSRVPRRLLESTWSLFLRELRVTWRNKAYVQGRLDVAMLMGLIYATMHYQGDPQNVRVVIGAMFPAVLYFTLAQGTQVPSLFIASRDIFYKQRGANFYRISSYVVAVAFNQVPVAFLEVLLHGTVEYWMCGFVSSAWNLLVFELVLFVTDLTFAGWFFFLTAATPTLQIGQPVGMMTSLAFVLFTGFILTHDNVPDYFIWAYWLNPLSWGVRSLAINQYGHESFDKCVYDGIDYCKQSGATMGVGSLKTYDMYTEQYWVWLGIVALLMFFVAFNVLAGLALEYCRFKSQDSAGSVPIAGGDEAENFRIQAIKRLIHVGWDSA